MKKLVLFIFSTLVPLSMVLSVASSAQAQTVSTNFCYTFTQNLGEGRTLSPADAQALATVLSDAGFWNANTPITVYNDSVASAVSGFQGKYASQILTPNGLSYGTGYVGASTRAELNSLYGCDSTPTAGATGQTFQMCPAGWTCTPPSSNTMTFSCPTGWTCAPANINSTASTYLSGPVSAALSLDPATPIAETFPVSNEAAGTYLNLHVLTFDMNAEGTNLHLHSVTVNLTDVGPGSVTNAYLYQGSTLVASTQISDFATNVAVFNNIPDNSQGSDIPANTSVPFTVTVDVKGLANIANNISVPVTVTASVSPVGVTVYNSADNSVTVGGEANGNPVIVESTGVRFSLRAVPTIAKQSSTADAAGNYTETYTAAFEVQATTVDTSATLGLPGSSLPAIVGDSSLVSVFENSENINGPSESLSDFTNATISYSQPPSTTLSSDGTSFTIAPNQVVMVPVTFSFTVNGPNENAYSVALRAIDWTSTVGGQVQHSALYGANANNSLMTPSI